MRAISTRTHGVLDYVVSVLLILAPWLFGFSAAGAAAVAVPVAVGMAGIVIALLTRYELGAADIIAMPVNLQLDAGFGAFLVISPWLFGFAGEIWWPHVVAGLIALGGSVLTRTGPINRDAPSGTVATRHGGA